MEEKIIKKFAEKYNTSEKKAKEILADMRHLRVWQGVSLGMTARIVSIMHKRKFTKDCVRHWMR